MLTKLKRMVLMEMCLESQCSKMWMFEEEKMAVVVGRGCLWKPPWWERYFVVHAFAQVRELKFELERLAGKLHRQAFVEFGLC
jgi:hypothetical protein